ncbi:hypothetical protein BJ508DRAFT_379202 [Ascobolus immersus RN42]|uniref:Extracellular membrane protein CFEM domain-containing protein n=1 Tax=Ascobolus immersus RN42 TaxID=1160509 RepID=A0A3N4HSS9_ASCIM|nr:hypothetical protein BJ508DRAFT_379202 [Ascobolus immersus RN42]
MKPAFIASTLIFPVMVASQALLPPLTLPPNDTTPHVYALTDLNSLITFFPNCYNHCVVNHLATFSTNILYPGCHVNANTYARSVKLDWRCVCFQERLKTIQANNTYKEYGGRVESCLKDLDELPGCEGKGKGEGLQEWGMYWGRVGEYCRDRFGQSGKLEDRGELLATSHGVRVGGNGRIMFKDSSVNDNTTPKCLLDPGPDISACIGSSRALPVKM